MIAPPRPSSPDALKALIKEARERQQRRRLLGTAGIAIIAAAGLAIYALAGGGARDEVTSGPPRSAAPICRSSQLSVAARWNGAAGNLFNFFTITNTGAGACSVPGGRPTVLLTRDGSQLKLEERVPSEAYPGQPVSSLPGGQQAVVHLDWKNWCGPQLTYAKTATVVTVQFAGGLSVTAPPSLEQPPCMDAAYPSVITASRLLTPN